MFKHTFDKAFDKVLFDNKLAPSGSFFQKKDKWKKLRKAAALFCSLLFHVLLLIILSYRLDNLYKIRMDLAGPKSMQFVNFFPTQPNPIPKSVTQRKSTAQPLQQKSFISRFNKNIIAINKRVLPTATASTKQVELKKDFIRKQKPKKKIKYEEKKVFEDSLEIKVKKIFYDDNAAREMSSLNKADVIITVNLPIGNRAPNSKFMLSGSIKPGIKKAFLTVNEKTNRLQMNSENFSIMVTLKKGINNFTVLALTKKGGVGKKSFKVLFLPVKEGPAIFLTSPKNGLEGVETGQVLWVEGTVSDPAVTKATLLLNEIAIPLKVKNGYFRRKIITPNNRINTFQVLAIGRNGISGYSAQHTVLAGYSAQTPSRENVNPRPY